MKLYTEKQHWQQAVQKIKQYALPRTAELERELSAVQAENRTLAVDLEQLRTEFEECGNRDRLQITALEQRLGDMEAGRDAACRERQRLDAALADLEAGRVRDRLQITALEQRLGDMEAGRDAACRERQRLDAALADLEAGRARDRLQIAALEQQVADSETERDAAYQDLHRLEGTLADFENSRAQDRSRITTLGQRISDIEAERNTLRQEVQILELGLVEAAGSREATEGKVKILESKLDAGRERYAAITGAIHETLTRLENEQHSLMEMRQTMTGPPDSGMQQQGVSPPVQEEPRRRLVRTASAAGLLVLGALAGATTTWDVHQQQAAPEPAVASQGIQDSLEHYLGRPGAFKVVTQPALIRDVVRSSMALPVQPGLFSAIDSDEDAIPPTAVPAAGEEEVFVPELTSVSPPAYTEGETPLLINDEEGAAFADKPVFDLLVKRQQENLQVLGFSLGQSGADGLKGARTRQALDEFTALYLPVTHTEKELDDRRLAAVTEIYARLVNEDATRYRIDSGVLAAIRLASLRTGVEYSFLMELAAAESAFDAESNSPHSSAAGLYQFTRGTWLNTVKAHGEQYGIGNYAEQVEYYVDRHGKSRPMIKDPAVYQHVLGLRYNPRLAALLAAESVKDNMQKLSPYVERDLGRTEMYLTHFLGTAGAISFLKALEENPDAIASDIFPQAAQSNQVIFSMAPSEPRTVAEVYEIFNRKFNTSRFTDQNPG